MVFRELWLSGCLQSVFQVEMLNPRWISKISGIWGINHGTMGLRLWVAAAGLLPCSVCLSVV